jgi:hypothetical protein
MTERVHLKDGGLSPNRTLLIDGQQRITALKAAILGDTVTDKNYTKKNIRIAFNPTTEEFRVSDAAIEQSKKWISDISIPFVSVFFKDREGLDFSDVRDQYFTDNPEFQNVENKDDRKKLKNHLGC